jgi:putative oligomerization/nucleic acid binding protein
MKSRTGPRILTTIAVATLVASIIGFFVTLMLNTFVFDEYDAYGEVPIPGTASLQLPAGDVTVSFHTQLIGSTTGNGLPVPSLKYRIEPSGAPDGAAELELVEDYGSTTTVNNDARVRIGYLHVPTAGAYEINLDGNVSAYLSPRLAFGHGSSHGNLPIVFAVIFGFAIVDLVIARVWAARVRRSATASPGFAEAPIAGFGAVSPMPRPMSVPPPSPFTPSDQGIRIQSLNTLARLRDSGALTQEEYEAEKRRVLEGP